MSVRSPRKVAIDGARAPYRGSFIGREQDLVTLEASLEDDARLTTLLGPGGVGKTRLLHRWLEVVRPRFERVLYVELADARTSGDVIQRVAEAVRGAALGATATENEAARRVGSALARALPHASTRKRGTLLALDNLEQLDPRAFELLPRWLGHSDALRIIVTSRVRLGLSGERVVRVAPLAHDGALRLFEDRVRLVRAPLDERERTPAAEIVRLLEGMPLALEMAATRLVVLSPQELLVRLARPLTVLAGGTSDPERHASLTRVLDGSWQLLDEREQRCLAELGVFVGGFTLEAAEAIAEAGASDVLSIVQRLADCSLIRNASSDRAAALRHSPWEVVREYAIDRLASEGRLDEVRLRHAEHFASWSERRLALILELDARQALQELVADEANLNAAARFATSLARREGDADATYRVLALRLLTALEPVRMLRGQLDSWTEMLDEGVSSLLRWRGAGPTRENQHLLALLARAELARARGLHELGRSERARLAYGAAIDAAERAQDATLRAWAHVGLGRLMASTGKWRLACASFDEASSLDNASASVRSLARACYEFYGTELGVSSDPIGAALDYLAFAKRAADPRERIFWTVQLGRLESELSRERDRPEPRFEEALALARDTGDLRGEAFARFALGMHYVGHGRFDEALGTLEEAARLQGEAGTPRFEGWSLGFVALAHMGREQWDEACPFFDRAIAVLHQVGDAPRAAHYLAFRGALFALQGGPDAEARARADFDLARTLAPADSRYHRWTLDLCAAQLHVLAGRRASARSEPEVANDELTRASTWLERATWSARPAEGAHVWPWGLDFYETRLACEFLERAIAAARARMDSLLGALRIAPDGGCFVLPDGYTVAVPGRGKLQRILVALAENRLSAQREGPLSTEKIAASGWPDERLRSAAASNRVHVALDALRKLGLRDLLVRSDKRRGFELAPHVPVMWLRIEPSPRI